MQPSIPTLVQALALMLPDAEVSLDGGDLTTHRFHTVVDGVPTQPGEIGLDSARALDPSLEPGDEVGVAVDLRPAVDLQSGVASLDVDGRHLTVLFALEGGKTIIRGLGSGQRALPNREKAFTGEGLRQRPVAPEVARLSTSDWELSPMGHRLLELAEARTVGDLGRVSRNELRSLWVGDGQAEDRFARVMNELVEYLHSVDGRLLWSYPPTRHVPAPRPQVLRALPDEFDLLDHGVRVHLPANAPLPYSAGEFQTLWSLDVEGGAVLSVFRQPEPPSLEQMLMTSPNPGTQIFAGPWGAHVSTTWNANRLNRESLWMAEQGVLVTAYVSGGRPGPEMKAILQSLVAAVEPLQDEASQRADRTHRPSPPR